MQCAVHCSNRNISQFSDQVNAASFLLHPWIPEKSRVCLILRQ
jgi:hypothetical protein